MDHTSEIHLRNDLTRAFVAALRKSERDDDVSGLASLFADDAEMFRLDGEGVRHGNVREFWETYRAQFGEVRTQFTRAVENDRDAALEWHSVGTRPDGREIRYDGSTFVTFDGERITGLRTYYDSAAFLDMTAGTG
ncbi:nuclear transport factor 2 family protein [Pseudonocardia ailaonensis]|uniref:Nuclear transport factor 2 family protein n=1 Tax=Pseudonocardia ailaonensis TaxID=367279 RepID=A0ABN2NQT1_9PSEU